MKNEFLDVLFSLTMAMCSPYGQNSWQVYIDFGFGPGEIYLPIGYPLKWARRIEEVGHKSKSSSR